jgi:DNA repair exonuclease SbcCD ATPase subunit
MRTCTWCGAPLPEPPHKGHRRQEFCKRPKTCRQQFYLWRKKMQEDAAKLSDPSWRVAYSVLVGQYQALERLMQERLKDAEKQQEELEEKQKRIDLLTERMEYYQQQYEQKIEALRIDYYARLKALGISEQDLREFNEYWKKQMGPFNGETV